MLNSEYMCCIVNNLKSSISGIYAKVPSVSDVGASLKLVCHKVIECVSALFSKMYNVLDTCVITPISSMWVKNPENDESIIRGVCKNGVENKRIRAQRKRFDRKTNRWCRVFHN